MNIGERILKVGFRYDCLAKEKGVMRLRDERIDEIIAFIKERIEPLYETPDYDLFSELCKDGDLHFFGFTIKPLGIRLCPE